MWQQRWFGPIFPIVYGVWMAGGAITGAIVWLRHRDTTVRRRRRAARLLLQPVRALGVRGGPQLAATSHDPSRGGASRSGPSTLAPPSTTRTATRSVDREREPRQPAQHDAAVPLGLSVASSSFGKRRTSGLIASRPSSRARCAPRQEWTPPPNDMCWLASARRRSSVSAVVAPLRAVAVGRAEAGHQQRARFDRRARRSRSRRA